MYVKKWQKQLLLSRCETWCAMMDSYNFVDEVTVFDEEITLGEIIQINTTMYADVLKITDRDSI